MLDIEKEKKQKEKKEKSVIYAQIEVEKRVVNIESSLLSVMLIEETGAYAEAATQVDARRVDDLHNSLISLSSKLKAFEAGSILDEIKFETLNEGLKVDDWISHLPQVLNTVEDNLLVEYIDDEPYDPFKGKRRGRPFFGGLAFYLYAYLMFYKGSKGTGNRQIRNKIGELIRPGGKLQISYDNHFVDSAIGPKIKFEDFNFPVPTHEENARWEQGYISSIKAQAEKHFNSLVEIYEKHQDGIGRITFSEAIDEFHRMIESGEEIGSFVISKIYNQKSGSNESNSSGFFFG